MINWQDKTRFTIGSTAFRCYDWVFGSQPSTPQEYFLQKDAAMVKNYERVVQQLQPANIFELGIWQGGSCVFFNELAMPEKLVAIELSEERISAVDQYIAEQQLEDTLIPLYGVDQADSATLKEIVEREFGGQPLDLIIDDASHFISETRSSFNLLFPRLRPGGVFIIEDWSWAHDPVDNPKAAVNLYPEREPLSRLVFEIILAAGSSRDLIESVEVNHYTVAVRRGQGAIEQEGFNIAECSLERGRNMLANHPSGAGN